MTSPSSPTDNPLLRWRTRDTARQLLLGFVTALAIAAATGLLLWLRVGHGNFIQVLLTGHLVAGMLALIFFLPFVVIHWRDGREPLRHLFYPFRLIAAMAHDACARRRLIGHGLLWSMLAVLASGVLVSLPAIAYLAAAPQTLPYGGHVWLLRIHDGACIPLLILLCLHFPGEDRR